MNRRSAFFFCLIVCLTTGQALGQSDLGERLSDLKDSLKFVKRACADMTLGDFGDAILRMQQFGGDIRAVIFHVDLLSESSGTFLSHPDNQMLLKSTAKLTAQLNSECMKTVTSRLSKLKDDPNNVVLINGLLFNMRDMVEQITSAFEQKLGQWSISLGGNPVIVESRRTLLDSFETVAEQVCEVKKNTTDKLNDQTRRFAMGVLERLREAAGMVTCPEILECIVNFLQITRRIDTKAKCL